VARLPVQGSDIGNWGEVLNEFLRVEHNEDGTLKLTGSLGGKYSLPLNGIPKTDLTADVQSALARAELALTEVPVITKSDIGLGNVTNETQLPLTGGTLTGSLRVNDGNTIRAYHTDNVKYIEIKADNFWSRINAGGTSGFVLQGATVQMDGSSQIVTNSPTLRPGTHLGTNIGTSGQYYNQLFARRHFFNSTAYLDGATAGVIAISDGAMLALGTGAGTTIGTAAAQKLGFYGVAPVAQQTGGGLTAAASYGSTEQLMLNRLWTALRNLGLIN